MKRIALINDLSGFGKCSLAAAIPVISVMGMQACPMPTAILSAQTEFPDYYCKDCTDGMREFTDRWQRMDVSFDGIYSGFLANPEQIERVLEFLSCFHQGETLYLADPVMGDQGQRYHMATDPFLTQMKRLTQMADVITPNLTELCILADENYTTVNARRENASYLDEIRDLCERVRGRARREQTVVVTGILRDHDGATYIGNLAVSDAGQYYTESPYTGVGFSGTGDLFASVICGSLVRGLSIKEAMDLARDFLEDAIVDATNEGIPRNHGVDYERYLYRLIPPMDSNR